MVWQSKKVLLISLSLILGIFIVAGTVITTYISDNNNDEGIANEWRDSLSITQSKDAPARIKKSEVKIDDASLQATTTTDIISRKLLVEYALSQKSATTPNMSDSDAQKIAISLVNEIKLPTKKVYALSDLNISNDNTYNSNLLYITSVSKLLKEFVATRQNETELTLLVKAVETNNEAPLAQIGERILIFDKLIKNLLILKTPSNVSLVHLHLIQAYETMRSATLSFKNILSDPALGLASLAEYRNGIDALSLAERELREFNFSKQ